MFSSRFELKKQNIIILFIICFFVCGNAYGANRKTGPANASADLDLDTLYPPLKTSLPSDAPAPPAIVPQPVNFAVCNKFFKIDSEKLLYLTLAGINANRFSIDEIQSKSGYIIFTAAQRQYLASVIKVDAKNSMLKITPCDNFYYFPVGIVQNMFKYVELNVNTPIENLSAG